MEGTPSFCILTQHTAAIIDDLFSYYGISSGNRWYMQSTHYIVLHSFALNAFRTSKV